MNELNAPKVSVGTKIKRWLHRTKAAMILSLVLAGLLTGITSTIHTNIQSVTTQYFAIFGVLFVVVFAIINLTTGANVYYYLLMVKRLNNVQKHLDTMCEIPVKHRKLIELKLKAIDELFLKKAMQMRFMNANYYDDNEQYNKLIGLVMETVEQYHREWRVADVPNEIVVNFENYHNKNMIPMLTEFKSIIYTEYDLVERRKRFCDSIIRIVESSMVDFIKTVTITNI